MSLYSYAQIWDSSSLPPMTDADESEILTLASRGVQSARMEILCRYRPAMAAVIDHYLPRAQDNNQYARDLQDYRQSAIVGVLEAIAAWRPDVCPVLAGIVREYVTQAVAVQACQTSGFAVPTRTLKRFFGIAALAEYDVDQGADLASAYDMSPATFRRLFDMVWVRSLDTPPEDSDPEQGDYWGHGFRSLYDTDAPTEYEDAESTILVQKALDAVDTTERTVTLLAYGFVNNTAQPDAEIGHHLGMSRQKTQRTRNRALGKMRVALGCHTKYLAQSPWRGYTGSQ